MAKTSKKVRVYPRGWKNPASAENGKLGGCPMKYKTAEELEAAGVAWCEAREAKGEPLTMGGLALALDMDRVSIINYSKNDRFFKVIKTLRERVRASVEDWGLRKNSTFAIFWLKNNDNYVDKRELAMTADLNLVTLNEDDDDTDEPDAIEVQGEILS